MPKVSVIIPAYNSGPYLDEAVQSVIAQTFTDWECIVIDDGSTEDLTRVENMDPRVRLLRQPNRGTQAARNNGILHSTGEFIAFLDHDDLWLPSKLEKQIAAMRGSSELAFCHTGFDVVDGGGNRTGAGWASAHDSYADMMRDPGGWCFSSVLVCRSALSATGLMDEYLMHTGDWDMMLKVAKHGKQAFIPDVLCRYRIHSNNTSRNYSMMCREALNVMEKHALAAEYRRDPAVLDAIKIGRERQLENFGCQAYAAARANIREKNWRGFRQNILLALKWNPGFALGSLAKYPLQKLRRRSRNDHSSLTNDH
jgi:glycosyltransferase involved in cell wall biosynthesis